MTDTAWALAIALCLALIVLGAAVDLLLDRRAELRHKDVRIADLQDDVQQARRRQCTHLTYDTPSWVDNPIPQQRQGDNS